MYTLTPTLKSNVCAFAGSEQRKTERSFTVAVKIAELIATDYVIIHSVFTCNHIKHYMQWLQNPLGNACSC